MKKTVYLQLGKIRAMIIVDLQEGTDKNPCNIILSTVDGKQLPADVHRKHSDLITETIKVLVLEMAEEMGLKPR